MASSSIAKNLAQLNSMREIHGVVVTAGLIDKTVKHFDDPKTYLVHDPANSLRQGDVIAISPGWRTSKSKRHVVKHIIAPGAGLPISARPPIPSAEELVRQRVVKKEAKEARKSLKDVAEKTERSLQFVKAEATEVEKELKTLTLILESRTKKKYGWLSKQTQ
ncbi:uncharacterized protein PODANS_5_5580 [Podospora anserina S mat+]|uniref:Podospora anserina S mat+ genomic DNA chromosome 5, supercontig 6 n=2 Tax=Podospora anserina TaxID=2587412 RepID=B2VLB6_PODAN|nr:uncharacterized protein PODANS_5_5580 [Podospora anserina S mat+]CAD60712.1 unnamed protein product [Podospora anserina]CAP49232.1 unnamed protein product [Podospora anserina S mat+]CDP29536.1 Putative protein of unknown function [Podospora anserina S mat+]